MTESRLYVEGGGTGRDVKSRCREAFRKLLENSGLAGRLPRVVACGSRNDAYNDFCTAVTQPARDYRALLLVDSERPMASPEEPWAHLTQLDGWDRPPGADDRRVFLMTTCMEAWIVADRDALTRHYGSCLQSGRLPSLTGLEGREAKDVQKALAAATRSCVGPYVKGKRAFEVLAAVDPNVLRRHLPAFSRMIQILDEDLPETL